MCVTNHTIKERRRYKVGGMTRENERGKKIVNSIFYTDTNICLKKNTVKERRVWESIYAKKK